MAVTSTPITSAATVIEIGRVAVEVTLLVSMPMFLAALVTGLVISIFQAATQIHEATLSFVPKLLAAFATLGLAGPWMLSTLVDYIRGVLLSIPSVVG